MSGTVIGTAFDAPFKNSRSHYCYPREKLVAEPVFPYMVLDGGAFQFTADVFGGADSDLLLQKTMDGSLFDVFRSGGEFNWEKSFAYTAGTNFRPKYEWQIWPQRLYMTIPPAHAYLRTGDPKYSDKWLEIVRGWSGAHPYQPYDPDIHYVKTDMVWRDMQVSWRTLSLLHGMFMLQDAPFSEADWLWLYDFVELHAEHLAEEARERISRNYAQNHVLQIGVALVMAGALLPWLKNAGEYVALGSDTVKMNMEGAIYKDGGSNENSPSYSHFIARLYLEAYLMLENNGLPPVAGLKESISRQYEWMYHCMAPDGRALRISDSYAMSAEEDIRWVAELFPLDFSRDLTDRLFPDSRMAILRRGDITLFCDAMDFPHPHQHAGRPQTLVYLGKEPLLVDAGCYSYDRWEIYTLLKDQDYHNVVYCPDITPKKITTEVTLWKPEDGIVETKILINEPEGSYEWVRRLVVSDEKIAFYDRAVSDKPLRWKSRLYFSRRDMYKADEHKMELRSLGYHAYITTELPYIQHIRTVMDDENKINYAIVLECGSEGEMFENTTEILIKKL
ncbi:MAG TPA: hypothetical protein GX704_02970 [Clostridiales bacterium]|jgi:hypothetical protein|nr:hypothetical protein [Clostridiales bacterium]